MKPNPAHPQRELYQIDIEIAIQELIYLQKDELYTIPKITWWVLKNEELKNYSFEYRHTDSCVEGMSCKCAWDSPESKFNDLYSDLEQVVDLYNYEKYFEKEMSIYQNVKEDPPALLKWILKNEKLGKEDFFIFWIEWLEEDNLVNPNIKKFPNIEVKISAKEFESTIQFLEVFNELYWTSGLCKET